MRIRRSVVVVVVAVLVASGLTVGLTGSASSAASWTAVSDFNCDGSSDVAVAEPGAARFHVLYGHAGQLTATSPDDQLITSVNGSRSYGDAMVTGDFNHDGCADLAVGDRDNGSGRVSIFLGSRDGLTNPRLVLSNGMSAAGANFGVNMAVGDINGDGRDDLVVGAWGELAIYVYLGSSSGLSPLGFRYADGVNGVPGDDNVSDAFGRTVAVGDFDGDGHADVAIGAEGAHNLEGRVYVLRGTSGVLPLTTTGAQTWSQNSPGVPGTAEPGALWGASLAVGNFGGGVNRMDLAVGDPIESSGVVDVLFSAGSSGLSGSGAQQLDGSEAGGSPSDGLFGWNLAVGDFDGNGADDLAVGQPTADVSAGAVSVFYSHSGGTMTSGVQRFTEASAGVYGSPEANDRFGFGLAAVEVTSSHAFDLVIGVPGETAGGPVSEGMIELLPGTTNGLTGTGSEAWTVGSAGVKGTTCASCWFGNSVAGPSSTSAD